MREDLEYTKTTWTNKSSDDIQFEVTRDGRLIRDVEILEVAYDSHGRGHIVFSKVGDEMIPHIYFDIKMIVKNEDRKWYKQVMDIQLVDDPYPGGYINMVCTPLCGPWHRVSG